MDPEWRKPGRHARVSPEEYVSVIKTFKERIVWGQKIVPATNTVWCEISKHLNDRVKAESIHSLTVNNRHGLLDILLERSAETQAADSSLELDDSVNKSSESKKDEIDFTISFGKAEFDEIIRESSSVVKNGAKTRIRKYTVLKPKKWTEMMAQKFFQECGLTHGFNFKSHYLYRNATGGSCKGKYLIVFMFPYIQVKISINDRALCLWRCSEMPHTKL